MIHEIPVIEHLDIQARDRNDTWHSLAVAATRVNVTRGGQRSVASNVMSVGVATITLLGDVDLNRETLLRPNVPIRLVLRDSDALVFTGAVADVVQAHKLDKSAGTTTTHTTLTVADSVQSLAATDRFGAVTDGGIGYEPWQARIARLMTSALVPFELPAPDPDDSALQDVVYESTLLRHLDLACNSVGARWWVDTSGIIQFRRALEDTSPLVNFSDRHGPHSYVDISHAHDTRNVANVLTLSQHGRKEDPEQPGNWIANNTEHVFTSLPSRLRWGARAGALETSLHTGTGHETALADRAADVLNLHGRPRYAANSIRANVQQDVTTLAPLDVYDLVTVAFQGRSQKARIIRIRHDITPTRWMAGYDLTDSKTGVAFDEWADAHPEVTFTDFNTATAVTTFTDYNADLEGGI